MADEKDMNVVEDEDLIITLELEDGTTEDCIVLAIYPIGEKQYIALVPSDKVDDEDGDVYLYGYEEDEEGNPILLDIEDDDEFDAACDRFDEICDEEEFEEIDNP